MRMGYPMETRMFPWAQRSGLAATIAEMICADFRAPAETPRTRGLSRLIALAAIYDGGSRTMATRIGFGAQIAGTGLCASTHTALPASSIVRRPARKSRLRHTVHDGRTLLYRALKRECDAGPLKPKILPEKGLARGAPRCPREFP
jgi:hypothetical protein